MRAARPFAGFGQPSGTRMLPEEVAVALTCNGVTQAVMMATPADLEDFARGFVLTEGIADPAGIEAIEPVAVPGGIDLRLWLAPQVAARLAERRRSMAGPVGCGLCGIESLAAAMAPVPPVTAALTLPEGELRAAVDGLGRHQPLHGATRAAHAAAFVVPGQGIVMAREDVGRHNALDKLAGALMAAGIPAAAGAVLVTSRVSVDLVQKAARMGAPVLAALSAPTAAAVDLAAEAGVTLAALARADRFAVFAHPHRITAQGLPGRGTTVAA